MGPKEVFRAMAEKKPVYYKLTPQKTLHRGIVVSMDMRNCTVKDDKTGKFHTVENRNVGLDSSEVEIIEFPKHWGLRSTLKQGKDFRVLKKSNGLVLLEYIFGKSKNRIWLAESRLRYRR